MFLKRKNIARYVAVSLNIVFVFVFVCVCAFVRVLLFHLPLLLQNTRENADTNCRILGIIYECEIQISLKMFSLIFSYYYINRKKGIQKNV